MEAIKLNLVPSDLTKPICHASQFDDGREIMLMLYDGQMPYVLSDEEIELDVKKLDGNIVTTDLTVESGTNYVIMVTTEQMCAIAGRNNCELKVQKDGKTIHSKNFYLSVEESVTAGGVESESAINNLETQIAGMVEDAVENQYDSENVIFDSTPTAGHGTGYTVTSEGIKAAIDAAGGGGASIDDTITASNKTWSSNKINTELGKKPEIDDASTASNKTWSASKINTLLDGVTEEHSEVVRSQVSPFTLTAGYIGANGNVSQSTSYHYTNKIPVSEGDKIYVYGAHGSYVSQYRFVCCYHNGSAVTEKGGQNLNNPFIVPSGIEEVVLSIADSMTPTRAEVATTQSKKELVNQPDVDALVKISANAKENSLFYGFDYTVGNTFETSEFFEDFCSYKVSFFAKISTITGIAKLGKGIGFQYGGGIGFDGTNLYMYQNANSTPTQTQAHGLTLKDYVSITLDSDYTTQLKVTIATNGGSYTWTISTWFAHYGSLSFTANDNMSECKIAYTCTGLIKDTWLYGDSYFSNFDGKRWTTYLVSRGYRNYLLNAYGGRRSNQALTSFKLDLKMNRVPRRVIWCLGMNDKDGDSSANESWLSSVQEVMQICSSLNIELVLATIPNVPSTNAKNIYKNAYVQASGYRYIDFAKAVSLNGDSTWYDNMLSSDNIHPETQGALALYSQAIATVPELLL